jgi:hypothetical protein
MDPTGIPSPGHTEAVPVAPAHTATGQTYFPDAEWNQFRAQDLTAAKYIVGLMMGIFVVGLLLYAGVALIVANHPPA